jgi:hypothetical protein
MAKLANFITAAAAAATDDVVVFFSAIHIKC